MAFFIVFEKIYKKEKIMKRWGLPLLVFLITLSIFIQYKGPKSDFDLDSFSKIPVVHNGRVKPLDSVARHALIVISGKQAVTIEDHKLQAIPWFLDVVINSKKADQLKVFFIHNPDLKTLVGIKDEKQKFASFMELIGSKEVLKKQAEKARELKDPQRSVYQKALINLYDRLYFYHKLKNSYFREGIPSYSEHFTKMNRLSDEREALVERHGNQKKLTMNDRTLFTFLNHIYKDAQYSASITQFLPFPIKDKESDWMSSGQAIQHYLGSHDLHPLMPPYFALFSAYQSNKFQDFNAAASDILSYFSSHTPTALSRAKYEVLFNKIQPFYKSIILYILSFILVSLSWIFFKGSLYSSSSLFLKWAFAIHTIGLLSRMLLQWRPPVTNLYSSAIFVGWIAVLLGLYLEKHFKNKMGIFISSFIGFLSLIIAHHLSLTGGDTMEMMQAVLDSNFWLSTHVVTITIGYSGTYLAGFLGIVYIFKDKFSAVINDETQKELVKMTFGVVCFSLFFSFVGTVLGGIWADQSWGRFWGWDPKENGALMIVLWCAIMLHARLSGHIRSKGFMVMAVFGNIITSFSWFGVNMLGVGLHSYGFMDSAFMWLFAFTLTQVTIILFGLIPSVKR
ncbi:cytochrome C assembly protein [Candidatus Marinamargulisbacteria bacterium SCGC AAA071-K20]|nr:cytochrome C assembly protein [Candidatus Marinamargulisbacteria bacterium SCGC AAA071-K20]